MSKVIKLSDLQKSRRIAEIKDILVFIRKNANIRKEIKKALFN